MADFSITSSGRRLLVVNIAGILGGGALLYLVLRVRGALGAFFPLWAVIILWLAGDWFLWRRRGLRELKIDGSRIEIVRGKTGISETMDISAVSEIWLHERGGRKSLQLLMGGRAFRIPGVLTLYPFPKLRLTNDSFDDAEFDELIDRLERLKGGINRLG